MSNTRLPFKHPNTINDANEPLKTESQSSSSTQICQQLKLPVILEVEEDKDQIEADEEMLKLLLKRYLGRIIREEKLPLSKKTHKIQTIKNALENKMKEDSEAEEVVKAAVNDYFETQTPVKKNSR